MTQATSGERPTDPLAIWKRLTAAERRAITLMRQCRLLYRVKGGWKPAGVTTKVNLETTRKLHARQLVREQTYRRGRPLMLNPLGAAVADAGEDLARQRRAQRERRNIQEARRSALAAYRQAQATCPNCIDGLTFSCTTPDECATPEIGCRFCITRCTTCLTEDA